MGKGKGLRKYTKGHGTTWKKGQSSSSNPQCTRHRDAAKAGHSALLPGPRSNSMRSNEISTHTDTYSRLLTTPAVRDDIESIVSGIRSMADTSHVLGQRSRRDTVNSSIDAIEEDVNDAETVFSDGMTTASSVRSHVSDWTRCTNPTFERFLEYWSADSALHREMLSLLASATELIADRNGSKSANGGINSAQPSSNNTEYFAIFLASSANSPTTETMVACYCLAGMLADKLPESIRRAKFSDVTKQVLTKLHTASTDMQNSPLFLLSCIKILSSFLRCQDDFTWNQPSTVQVFDTILHLLVHAKPKVRKAAAQATTIILRDVASRTQSWATSDHPAALRTVTFIREKLNDYLVTNNESGLLQLLGIVQQVIPYFPANSVRPLIEFCLRLLGHGQVLLALVALKTLRAMFPKRSKDEVDEGNDDKKNVKLEKAGKSNLTYETAAQLLNALYEHQPNAVKVSLITKWLALQSSILLYLVQTRPVDGIKHLPHFVRTCAASIWQLQQQAPAEAHDAAGSILAKLFVAMPKIISTDATGGTPDFGAVIKSISDTLQPCFTFPFHMTWKPVTLVCGALFTMLNDETDDEAGIILMAPLLQCLAEIRQQPQCPCIAEIDRALIAAVKSLGPEFVLQALPLKYNNNIGADMPAADNTLLSFEGTWILPIIHKALTAQPAVDKRKVKLANFLQEFVPLLRSTEHAIKCMKSSTVFHTDSYYDNLRACQSIESQTWSLFAAYCRYACDLATQFPHVAQRFGELMQAQPPRADDDVQTASELHRHVLAVLRCAVLNTLQDDDEQNAENQHRSSVMSNYAKNYLPRLCAIYTDFNLPTDKSRLPALETFKLYLRVTPRDLASSMLQDILNNKLLDDLSILRPPTEKSSSSSNWLQKNEKFCALLDLVIALVPYAATVAEKTQSSNNDDDTVAKANAKALVGLVVALLNAKHDDAGRFKKACRLMEELFRCNCTNVRQLKTAVLSACPTKSSVDSTASKAPWLRCVRHLLIHSAASPPNSEFDAELIRKLLPTVMAARKELNVKTRAAADAVVLTMAEQYVMQANEDQNSGNVAHLLTKVKSGDGNKNALQSDLLDEFIDYLLHKFFSYPPTDAEKPAEILDQSRATLQVIVSIVCRFKSMMSASTVNKLVSFLCSTVQAAQATVRIEQKQLLKLHAKLEAEAAKAKEDRNKMLPPSAVTSENSSRIVKRGIHRANPVNVSAAPKPKTAETEKDAEMDEEVETATEITEPAVASGTPSAELKRFYSLVQSVLLVFDAVVTKIPFFGEHVMNMVTLLYSNNNNNMLTVSTRKHFHRKLSELTTRMLRKYDYTMLQQIWPEDQRKLLSAPRKRERKQVAKKIAAEKDEQSRKRKKIGKKQRAHERLLKGNAAKILLGGESDAKAVEDDQDEDDEEEAEPIFEDEEFRARSARRSVSQRLREPKNQIIDFLEPRTMSKQLY